MARHLAGEGKRRSGGARPAAAVGAAGAGVAQVDLGLAVVAACGRLMLPKAGDRAWVCAAFGLLVLGCCPGGLMSPHSGQKLAKKLKMAILG